ncbi:MAG: nucleotidyltransferase family protein [Bacteroidales bacterium]|jgi:NDP-sugar pyrophosphorylase family protein|nr:nucleotidyltransferase family protein [Bacteroidales bacterium]
MKALILAAGFGTRLRPITDTRPKALVEVGGKTLLEHALTHLKVNGIREVIINVHHFPALIVEFLRDHDNFGLDISISDESDELLDTGGGMKKTSWFFDDGSPFIVRNVDVLSDLDLSGIADFHHRKNALATLAVRERATARYFLFDEQMCLAGWENQSTGERRISRASGPLKPFAFSGIQIVNPAIFPMITETGRFSLTGLYLRLSEDHIISGYLEMHSSWKDAGKWPL